MTAGGRGGAALLLAGLVALASPAGAELPAGAKTPSGVPARLDRAQAQALLATLNAELLSHPSATLTLDRWCATHGIAPPGTPVVADRLRDITKPATAAQRALLAVEPDEPVRYRRVALRCGSAILSRADNWYVPARLTPAINAALETSDIAFGRAVQALGFTRHTLGATVLPWPVPTSGSEAAAAEAPPDPPVDVITHRALLTLPDQTPFSLVVETYTRAVLGFSPTPRP